MDAAYINGFSPFSTGCHVIIAAAFAAVTMWRFRLWAASM